MSQRLQSRSLDVFRVANRREDEAERAALLSLRQRAEATLHSGRTDLEPVLIVIEFVKSVAKSVTADSESAQSWSSRSESLSRSCEGEPSELLVTEGQETNHLVVRQDESVALAYLDLRATPAEKLDQALALQA